MITKPACGQVSAMRRKGSCTENKIQIMLWVLLYPSKMSNISSPFARNIVSLSSTINLIRNRVIKPPLTVASWRLYASVLFICSFDCLFVRLSVAKMRSQKRTRFSQKLTNLELLSVLTPAKSQRTHYWTPKIQDGGNLPS